MLERNGFKNLGLILALGTLVGACSPLAPSVSKLSNAAGDKTTPTDGQSPASSVSTQSGSTTSGSQLSAAKGAQQQTVVEPMSSFRRNWDLLEGKPAMKIDGDLVTDLVTSSSGSVEFPSALSDHYKGQEEALAASKILILVGVNVDSASIASLNLRNIMLNVSWVAATETAPAHFKLSLVTASTDPAQAANELKEMKDALHDHYGELGIVFQAD